MQSTTSCAARAARRPGFTLIELLTVIAIIGILAAILIPTVSSVRSKAKTLQCVSRLRGWGQAVRLFATDNKGNVPYLINLSGDDNMRFYDPYFPKGNDGVTNTIHPMDFYSVCPSIDRSGKASDDTNRRYYNFVRPNGYKTAKSGSNFCQRVIGKDVAYVTIESVRNPSRLFLMLEQIPGSDAPMDGGNYVSELTTKVKPIMIGTDASLIRHNGSINVLYFDGAVRGQHFSDLEFKPGAGASLTGDPRFNL